MKQIILTNWTFLRILRLVAGIAIIVQAVITKQTLFGIVGILFTSMAIFNTGCCGTGGCDTAFKNEPENTKDITYEEVV
jgi:hypothetical protein